MRGSPPHTWGILGLGITAGYDIRFTPTHVGNTHLALALVSRMTVHPHTRGEYSYLPAIRYSRPGSPPHTWGILVPGNAKEFNYRFTPTHVGNTSGAGTGQDPLSVHPHTRGEYGPENSSSVNSTGSPPHTWGILHYALPSLLLIRFTPTHVGNTPILNTAVAKGTVHPHTRGEYMIPSPRERRSSGSPPHTWGIRQQLPCRSLS